MNKEEPSSWSATVVALSNPLILENIISHLKWFEMEYEDEEPEPFLRLRIVSHPFSKAVIKDGRFILNLGRLFGTLSEREDKPIPPDTFPQLGLVDPDVCKSVKMTLCGWNKRHKAKFEDKPFPVTAINLINFLKTYGSCVQDLQIDNLTKVMYHPIALAVHRACPNLSKIQIYQCKDKDEDDGDRPEALLQFPPFLNAKLRDVTVGGIGKDCEILLQMLKSLILAPNLQMLNIKGTMTLELSGCRKLKCLKYFIPTSKTPFDCQSMKTTIRSAARIERLEVHFSWLSGGSDRTVEEALERNQGEVLGPMPHLQEFQLRAEGFTPLQLGPFLADCVFQNSMPLLRSLRVDSLDKEDLGKFLLLIRDSFGTYQNKSLRKLKLGGVICEVECLSFLQRAFPNLETLHLWKGLGKWDEVGGLDGLRTVFGSLSLWTGLKEVEFGISFKFEMTDFGDLLDWLGPQFWNHRNLRKFTLHLPLQRSPNFDNFPFASFESAFLAMRGMDSVTLDNFHFPAVVKERLYSLIRENALPVDFCRNLCGEYDEDNEYMSDPGLDDDGSDSLDG